MMTGEGATRETPHYAVLSGACYFPFLILTNNQLDAKFFLLYANLFRFSTCFEQLCAHHQESQLYQYNIWCMSPT